MEKYYIVVEECMDPYMGDNAIIYNNERKAREHIKRNYKFKRWGELFEATLIDNTGYNKIF